MPARLKRGSSNWTQKISFNLRLQLILITALILATTGYGVWQQNNSKRLNALTNEYHLGASFHYSEAITYLKDIQHQIHEQTDSSRSHFTTSPHLSIDTPSFSDLLHIADREMHYGLDLQEKYNDKTLTTSTNRLRQHSKDLLASLNEASPNTFKSELPKTISRTLETLEQLVRLHTAIRDDITEQHEGTLRYSGTILFTALSLFLACGLYITWRSGHAIQEIVNKQKNVEKVIKHQATYDNLTDLPNRILILDRLSQLLHEARRHNTYIGVLFLDLDNFKKINDGLGHHIGDKLLIETGQRLIDCLRNVDTVGRLGGDEFVILLSHLKHISDIDVTLTKILQQLQIPFIINNRELLVTASIGISIYPEDGLDADTLLQHADSAMYHSKSNGRNTFHYFTDQMHRDIKRRIKLEEHMLKALEQEEFEVHYQPQTDFTTGQIIGAEALLRWNNHRLDNPSPAEFIPIAEQTGLIIPIGDYVIRSAFEQCAHWQQHTPDFRIAINLSPRQFRNGDLVTTITAEITRSGISAQNVELEITEGVLLSGQQQVITLLNELTKRHITLSMDDFGTGYSSLSYLRRFPFSIVKIDRSFISDINSNDIDRELIKAIIAMAHHMKLKVIAEGIEDQQQYQLLQELGCDFAQGYLLGKPMPADEFQQFLSKHTIKDYVSKTTLSGLTPNGPIGHKH